MTPVAAIMGILLLQLLFPPRRVEKEAAKN
jgi:hypothetical protein